MKTIISSIILALALISPALAGGGHGQGQGNNPPGSQNPHANPGSQSNGPQGNGHFTPPPSNVDTSTSASCSSEKQGRSKTDWAPMIAVGTFMVGAVCQKELGREDKTDFVTWFCTPGELPDPFESFTP